MKTEKIELHSAEPAGVHTIDEEADRPEAIHQDENGVFVICKDFALQEPIPAEPLPDDDEESRDLADAQDALKEPDGASWTSLKKKYRL